MCVLDMCGLLVLDMCVRAVGCWCLQESTDGSSIEAKESALVWYYKDADPDFGSWQVGLPQFCAEVS